MNNRVEENTFSFTGVRYRAVNQPEWATASWHRCKNVVSMYRNTCVVGSWALATSPFASTHVTITSRIIEILRGANCEPNSIVLLDLSEIMAERHTVFKMPVLTRPLDGEKNCCYLWKGKPFDQP